jgi:hypothetical protein
MRRKSNLASLVAVIALVGLVSSLLGSDVELRELFKNLESFQIESLLEYLNLGLGFLALVCLLALLFFRAARREGEKSAGHKLEMGGEDEDDIRREA